MRVVYSQLSSLDARDKTARSLYENKPVVSEAVNDSHLKADIISEDRPRETVPVFVAHNGPSDAQLLIGAIRLFRGCRGRNCQRSNG